MEKIRQQSDAELAECLNEWMGDAANSWDSFKDSEKIFFRQLQDEACKRFVLEHKEAADDCED